MLDDIRGIHGVRYTWIAVRFCEVYLGGEYIYIYIYAHTSWEGTRMNRDRFVGITLMLDNKKNATSNVNKFL